MQPIVYRIACASVLTAAALACVAPEAVAQSDRRAPAHAQTVAPHIYDAITRAKVDRKLGFTVSGLVSDVKVEPGDRVKAGDVLIELRHDESKALVELWDMRRTSDTEIKAAQARRDLAQVEAQRLRSLLDQQSVNQTEYEKAILQLELENLAVARAKEEQQQAAAQARQAQANLEQYILRAPADGVIDDVTVDEGELVEVSQPVLQLVDTTELELDVMVPTEDAGSLQVGDRVRVTRRSLRDGDGVEGTIIQIAQIADARSEARRLVVAMPNEHGWPAGMHMRVRILEREQGNTSNASAIIDDATATAAVME